ncbi:MAG: hypothetical protein ACRENA_02600 [Vulcanimicrobiaceae bacterium]
MARDRDDADRNIEKTKEIGTGVKGDARSYTGGNRVENQFPDKTTENFRREERHAKKDDKEPKDGTWESAKEYFDPDSK